MTETRYYRLSDGTVFKVDAPLRLEVWSDRLHILYHEESMERWDYATVTRKLNERHGHLYKMHLSPDLVHEVRRLEESERPPEVLDQSEPLNWPAKGGMQV